MNQQANLPLEFAANTPPTPFGDYILAAHNHYANELILSGRHQFMVLTAPSYYGKTHYANDMLCERQLGQFFAPDSLFTHDIMIIDNGDEWFLHNQMAIFHLINEATSQNRNILLLSRLGLNYLRAHCSVIDLQSRLNLFHELGFGPPTKPVLRRILYNELTARGVKILLRELDYITEQLPDEINDIAPIIDILSQNNPINLQNFKENYHNAKKSLFT